ncbi:hypothetical protein HMPREF9140_01158, partial [Prevotella micans F0438]
TPARWHKTDSVWDKLQSAGAKTDSVWDKLQPADAKQTLFGANSSPLAQNRLCLG